MSGIADFLRRVRDQINPLDHGKTAVNPSGLPANVPVQIPGTDTSGPTYQRNNRIINIPKIPGPQQRQQMVPIFGQDQTLTGYDVPTSLDWLGRPLPQPMMPSQLRPNTFQPLNMGAGDFEIPTVESYKQVKNQLPIYNGKPNKQVAQWD